MAQLNGVALPTSWFLSSDRGQQQVDIGPHTSSPLQRERWKYTSAKKIAALLDALPSAEPLPGLVNAEQSQLPDLDKLRQELPLATEILARAGQLETVVLNHGDHLLLDTAPPCRALRIQVAAGAQASLEEIYTSSGDLCWLVWIQLAQGATLTHSRNCLETGQQWHFLDVALEANSNYRLHNHVLGGAMMRQDIQINLDGAGARSEIVGSAVAGENKHLDQQLRVVHQAPNATSQQTFHTIAGERAKVTFGGRIHIHEGCDGSDAQLQNRNLALSENVTINTKPELEIYAEDVSCAHGATVGQLDETSEFYCYSRGIDPSRARSLLSRAFVRTTTQGPLAEAAYQAYQSALA